MESQPISRTSPEVSPICSQPSPPYIWYNGSRADWGDARVHVNAVGHASVSSVFEGIRAYVGDDGQLRIFRLADHLKRLFDSARISRLTVTYDEQAITDAICSLVSDNDFASEVYIRPWLFPSGIIREQIAPAWIPTDLVIDSWGVDSKLREMMGCKTCVSSWTRNGSNASPPMVKAFSNYHNSRFAALEAWNRGYDWPIFLNQQHYVSEGPGACIALIRNGRLITPDLASGILESITRDTILRTVQEHLNLEVVERSVERTELYLAEEVFFMGTGWEILPILSIDDLPVGDGFVGPLTHSIAAHYDDIVRGRTHHSRSWCLPVTDFLSQNNRYRQE